MENCQMTCQLCGSGGRGGCVDKDPGNCAAYSGYENTQYCTQGWAFDNCKKTCKLC
jgi:hypothetical protein